MNTSMVNNTFTYVCKDINAQEFSNIRDICSHDNVKTTNYENLIESGYLCKTTLEK